MEALVQPYNSWGDFPRAGSPPDQGNFFASLRGEAGFHLLVDQPEFYYHAMIEPLTGRPLGTREQQEYLKPAADPNARIPFWRWVNQLPVGGDPSGVAHAVSRYAAALAASCYPKLL